VTLLHEDRGQAESRVCYDIDGSRWGPLPGGGGSWSVLRRSADRKALSAMVRLDSGFLTTIQIHAEDLPTIGYVLEGVLEFGGKRCGRGAMVALRPGAGDGVDSIAVGSRDGATVVVIRRPDRGGCPGLVDHSETVLVATPEDMPVVESVVAGKKTGITRRVMWVDSTGGGDIRELAVPPGFVGAGRGHHPCGEEILCLDGAITADEEHELTRGWYLYNPAQYVHGGHEFSERGAVLLEWHDAAWDLVLEPG